MVRQISFRHFSDQLYCSGAQQQWCVLPGDAARGASGSHPGECLWHKPDSTAVLHEDMLASSRPRWTRDRWDPAAAGVNVDLRRFDPADAAACLRGKHVMILGESTTRDLYGAFADVAGLRANIRGCMNSGGRAKPICHRTVASADNETRVSFQFLSSSNASREMEVTRSLVGYGAPAAVFAYCMAYDWLNTVPPSDQPEARAPPSDAMGAACLQNIDANILSAAPGTPLFLLGPTYPPGWVEPYENRTRPGSRMGRLFQAIERPFGISCERKPDGDFKVVSARGVRGPIDRYNVVGHRKRDMIHPYDNAHTPTVQMMLNHMC